MSQPGARAALAGFLQQRGHAVGGPPSLEAAMTDRISLRTQAARFGRDEHGNFAVVTAFGLTMLMMAVGFGVNIVESHQVKMSLRDAMDAAVTSTARDLTTGAVAEADARALVQSFLDSNGDTRFITTDKFTLESLVIDRTAKTIEATASAHVDLLFPFFAAKDPKVSVTSAAVYSDKKVEIAMMLDVTGSMAKSDRQKTDKIGDLRSAAANAVELVLQQNLDPRNPRVRVALVPYADAVNVDALAAEAVFVEKEPTGAEPNPPDLPPAVDAPIAVSTETRIDNCATERKLADGSADFSDDGPQMLRFNNEGKQYMAKVNRDDRLTRHDGSAFCPTARLVPLTSDKDRLVASIGAYTASGVTAGAIGIQWTYYMLSPKWRSAIAAADLGAGPADYNGKKISKVAILMTDGQFNTAYAGVDRSTAVRSSTTAGNKSRSYAESLCDRMKADGIEIYTIGFDLNNKSMKATERDQAKAVLQDCASRDSSSIKHYFEASTGEELDAAFKEIIRNTERLALTK
jgi:Flp pilus assembly protein TadG